MQELKTLETNLVIPLNGYPENDDTDIGLITNDLDTIKSKLATYKVTDSTMDKIYNILDTQAGEYVLDKIDFIVKSLATANERQKLTPVEEFYKLLQSAFEDMEYEVSIEDEIYITLKLELPSYIIGLTDDQLEDLLDNRE